ncbi:putative septum site-determining protein MinC [Aureimonas endophytica]|uniref:Probable septum site-determining protein MinC n=1 Tax=Aureimonas endophytica TaxID=2027858 RepID=A0A916ZPE5_9HYPH|nr:septum site-determining protein MinC [Aureimonas endophytica]GGE07604.1 putative septum site-determining protein MinC [Aureimonas endophytica]
MTDQPSAPKPVRLRGRSFLALVLSPELPFVDWLASLDDLAKRSTGFFLGRPIVLDLSAVTVTREDVAGLIAALSERNVRIMGLEGVLPSQVGPGMPPLMQGGRSVEDFPQPAPDAPKSEPAPVAAEAEAAATPAAEPAEPAPAAPAITYAMPPAPSSLIIETTVRSGQQIVFTEGDVTVLGSVSSGAEVIAGGSVHIYGALRGRALAGAAGDPKARIFCQKLEAELIAIDGLYKTAEDIEPALRGRPMQAWLDGEMLKTVALV